MVNKKAPTPLLSKDAIARHLRAADAFAKEGRFDDALLEVQRALDLDPKNYYARSFQDRIRAEVDRRQQKLAQKEQEFANQDEKKLDAVTQLLREADQLIAAKNYTQALQVVAKVYKIDPKNYFASSYSDRIEILMAQEGEATQAVPLQQAAPQQIQAVPVATAQTKPSIKEPTRPEAPQRTMAQTTTAPGTIGTTERASLQMYREMLKEMWFDGKITPEEDQELKKVRTMFSITQQEHEAAEKQVHIEAYVDALKTAWRDGVVSSTENEVLQLMRQRFNITMEEHMSAETQILWARNKKALSKGAILVVDDDRTMLLSLAAALKKHGYDVLTAESVDKAVKQLEVANPVLVLADLMFGQGEKTGLEFYQYIRTSAKFKETPFLLMSGISDEFVVRAGMRMGVDEFLKKPFSLELLLATIEGKLKTSGASSPAAAQSVPS